MKAWFVVALTVLTLLHQDFWFWTDERMVFGFIPMGLAYHALYSLVTALFWIIVLHFAWPEDLEAWADETDSESVEAP